ncbi:MAG TPA: hypothetical protein VIV11_28730 [Kofleriaceae bacterium]
MRIISLVLGSLLAVSACRSAPAPTTKPAPTVIAAPDGTYKSGGSCAQGTPENPTCLQTLELAAGGKGSFIGDDIVEPATWTQAGDKITVAIGGRTMELQAKADGTLVDANGTVWKREPASVQ